MSQLTVDDVYVLLVEPSSAQQKIIGKLLSALGINNQSWVRTAEEAVAGMRKTVPDLVISAMHLSDMTGTELVQTMRGDADLQAIPFMLISSETHYRYLEPIRQAGVIAILPKPFTFEQLKKAIDSTIFYLDPGEVVGNSCINGEELNVLVVDDSALARKHITRVLNNMGIEHITTAENGAQALELVAHHYFDLIVTDYNMPQMDGGELVEHVRRGSAQAGIPIIMVSSETDESRLAAVTQAGVSAICDKPFDAYTVKQLIEKIVI
jgi:two-component system chemotaxis response regulator CheY